MDNGQFKKIAALVLGSVTLSQIVWAQEQPAMPPSGAVVASQADAAQYQTWLKNNEQSLQSSAQHQTVSAQMSTPVLAQASNAQTIPPSPETLFQPPTGQPGNIPTSAPPVVRASEVTPQSIPAAPLGQPTNNAAPSPASLVDQLVGNMEPPVTEQVIPPPPFERQKRSHSRHRSMHAHNNRDSDDDQVVISKPLTYQQSQEIMLNSAPIAPPPSADAEAAFNNLSQQNIPLTPQQVIRLRQMIDASQRAATIPANVPPKPVSSTLMINLAPGATPPAIRLSQGYVSSLVFVDSTGAPWPIAAYDIGDPKATSIQWDGKSNILLIQGVAPYSDSNLVLRLVGLPTPITLELVSGQRVVDYRTDIHVSGIGPNTTELPTGTGLPASANQILLSVLDGVAPSGSRQLTVTGGDCQAWLLADRMFVRTRYTVLSPGWIGKMVSPDGMNAYEMPKSSSILVSQYGDPIELKIEGF